MLALVASPSEEEKVALREVPEPQPRPDEALIEVRAISINRGEYNRLQTANDGWRPGSDVAGVVKQAAADGSSPPAGARVVGLSNFGGWCEQLPLTAANMAVIPDSLSFAAGASLPIAGLTALRTLRLGGLLLGRRVLVQGAAGGVGRFALQLGRMAGAHLTAVVGSAERGEGLRGADQVVVGIENAEGHYDLILENAGGVAANLLNALFQEIGQTGRRQRHGQRHVLRIFHHDDAVRHVGLGRGHRHGFSGRPRLHILGEGVRRRRWSRCQPHQLQPVGTRCRRSRRSLRNWSRHGRR